MTMKAGIDKKNRGQIPSPDVQVPASPPKMGASVSGMAETIYQKLSAQLEPKLLHGMKDLEPDARSDALLEGRAGGMELSYAVAKGVVEYLKENLDVKGVVCKGDIVLTQTHYLALQAGGEAAIQAELVQDENNRPEIV